MFTWVNEEVQQRAAKPTTFVLLDTAIFCGPITRPRLYLHRKE